MEIEKLETSKRKNLKIQIFIGEWHLRHFGCRNALFACLDQAVWLAIGAELDHSIAVERHRRFHHNARHELWMAKSEREHCGAARAMANHNWLVKLELLNKIGIIVRPFTPKTNE